MPLFAYNDIQTVQGGGNAILNDIETCPYGYVYHENGTGLLFVRGNTNRMRCGRTKWKFTAKGNIAVPTGGTVGEIGLGIAANGVLIPYSVGVTTPAAVDEYSEVTAIGYIDVPAGIPFTITVMNSSADPINIKNLVLVPEIA